MNRFPIVTVLVVLACIAFGSPLSFGKRFVTSAEADLDGDGDTEHISISLISGTYFDFVLHIDGDSIRGKLSAGEVDGFQIVDIDTTDAFQEVAVHTPGPSADDQYLIFDYNAGSIKEMGNIARWPIFLGNGIVIVEDWMDFWTKRDKYVLCQKTRTLKLVPQEMYLVGITTTVRESFPIYKTREDSTVVATLQTGDKVSILLYYPLDRFCFKSEDGIIGWSKFEAFSDKLYLNWAD
jgi:hypothetical protein